jgi:hypothetical protein
MKSVFLLTPEGSAIESWICETSYGRAQTPSAAAAIVFHPSLEKEAHRIAAENGLPCVACLPIETKIKYWFVADDAMDYVAVRADGYASEPHALEEALRHVTREDREQRSTGPLRLVWLGSLGESMPPKCPPIGTGIPLGEKFLTGRSKGVQLNLRQGAHSDQNTVARHHALIERTATGATVRDLRSTNGTWVDGRSIESAEIVPGDEVAIVGRHRLRLDGDPAVTSPSSEQGSPIGRA